MIRRQLWLQLVLVLVLMLLVLVLPSRGLLGQDPPADPPADPGLTEIIEREAWLKKSMAEAKENGDTESAAEFAFALSQIPLEREMYDLQKQLNAAYEKEDFDSVEKLSVAIQRTANQMQRNVQLHQKELSQTELERLTKELADTEDAEMKAVLSDTIAYHRHNIRVIEIEVARIDAESKGDTAAVRKATLAGIDLDLAFNKERIETLKARAAAAAEAGDKDAAAQCEETIFHTQTAVLRSSYMIGYYQMAWKAEDQRTAGEGDAADKLEKEMYRLDLKHQLSMLERELGHFSSQGDATTAAEIEEHIKELKAQLKDAESGDDE
ncbi:MAG: hypothetical protein AB7K09_07765 [Planctomycetota bacterium]